MIRLLWPRQNVIRSTPSSTSWRIRISTIAEPPTGISGLGMIVV